MTSDLMTSDEPAVVHQIIFGKRDGKVRRGLGAVAWSAEDSWARVWEDRLLPRVRMEARSSAPPPESSLYYTIQENNEAVLLHRFRTPESTAGQEICHGLIGPAGALTPRVALSLYYWSGWERHLSRVLPGPNLPRTSVADLKAEAKYEKVVEHLDKEAQSAENSQQSLEALVAFALKHPQDQLTVATAVNPLAQLWGFLHIVEALHSGLERLPVWTFSTWEYDDQAIDLPRVVFLSPHRTPSEGLRRVVPERLDLVDRYRPAGEYLVQTYSQSGPDGLRESLREKGILDPPDTLDRANRLLSYLRERERSGVSGLQAGPSASSSEPETPVQEQAPVQEQVVAQEQAPVQEQVVTQEQAPVREQVVTQDRAPVEVAVPDQPDGPYHGRAQVATHPTTTPSPLPQWSQPTGDPSRVDSLLDRLTQENCPEAVAHDVLSELSAWAAEATSAERSRGREWLGGRYEWLELLGKVFPDQPGQPEGTQAYAALSVLVAFAIGTDLKEQQPGSDIQQLVLHSSPDVAIALAKYATGRGEHAPLLASYGLRWLDENGLLGRAATVTYRRRGSRRKSSRTRRGRLLRWVSDPIVVFSAGALTMLFFLIMGRLLLSGPA
jgi:hypothetical protein